VGLSSMSRVRALRVCTLLLVVSGSACSSCGGSHALPAITASATTTSTSTSTSTTTSIVTSSANGTPPDTGQPKPPCADVVPGAAPTVDVPGPVTSDKGLPECWAGTMDSSSNYTVTASDGGLVCAGTWMTALKFSVAGDATVTGTATSTIQGAPLCTHPEFLLTPVTTMLSNITGTATATQLQLQLKQVSYQPAGSIDSTGMSASIYGINTPPATITIPIITPGHAAGSQQLQAVSSVNSYTSDNAITVDCQTC
jgi:hypothetical protein